MGVSRIALCQTKGFGLDMPKNAAALCTQVARQSPDTLLIFPPTALTAAPKRLWGASGGLSEDISRILQDLQESLTDGRSVLLPVANATGDPYRLFSVQQQKIIEMPLLFAPCLDTCVFSLKPLGLKIGVCILSLEQSSLEELCAALMNQEALASLHGLLLLTALPWTLKLESQLVPCLEKLVNSCNVPVAWLNAVGILEGSVFAGGSCVFARDGELLMRAHALKEKTLLLDANLAPLHKREIAPSFASWEQAVWAVLTFALQEYCTALGHPHVFLGLSGGMDSALVLTLAVCALGADKVTAILMPSPFNPPASREDALELTKRLAVEAQVVPIGEAYTSLKQLLTPYLKEASSQADTTFENLQARIRALVLMAFANRANGIVLNTSNKSEIAMGYSTLYGDTVGAFALLGDLTKTEVYALAAYYNATYPQAAIPLTIVNKPPSAELRPNQKDSDTLPEYALLDPLLQELFESSSAQTRLDPSLVRRFQNAEFKRRQEPFVVKITAHDFTSTLHQPLFYPYRPIDTHQKS